MIAVREEPNLRIVFYQQDVPDRMRTPLETSCLTQYRFKVNEFADDVVCLPRPCVHF